jgi:hypothetical protein
MMRSQLRSTSNCAYAHATLFFTISPEITREALQCPERFVHSHAHRPGRNRRMLKSNQGNADHDGRTSPCRPRDAERETTGGKVTEIEKEMKNGETIYSADVTINGVAWDVAIADDGTLIGKEKD